MFSIKVDFVVDLFVLSRGLCGKERQRQKRMVKKTKTRRTDRKCIQRREFWRKAVIIIDEDRWRAGFVAKKTNVRKTKNNEQILVSYRHCCISRLERKTRPQTSNDINLSYHQKNWSNGSENKWQRKESDEDFWNPNESRWLFAFLLSTWFGFSSFLLAYFDRCE